MKKIALLFICMLLLLTACKPRPGNGAVGESAVSEPELVREQPKQASSGGEEVWDESSGGGSDDNGDYRMGPYDEMLLAYGGEIEYPRDSSPYLRTSSVGFYFIDDWTSPEEIESGSFYSWYLSMVWKENLTEAEKKEKYKSPLEGDDGWFFPQDLYESRIQEYFDVSTEHLRAERYIYDSELEGYYLQGGAGVGERPAIVLLDVEKDGSAVKLHLRLEAGEVGKGEKKCLTVITLSDGGFKFQSYVTEE